MKRIIIVGNCLQNTVGLVRSIGEKGEKVDLIFEPCKRSDCFIKFSKYIRKIHYLDKIEDLISYLQSNYSDNSEKHTILVGSDPLIRLLDEHYDVLKDNFNIFNAGSQNRISFFLDKTNTFPIAEESGLSLIPTVIVSNKKDISDKINYPCFVKGENSTESTKADIKICDSRIELEDFIRDGVTYLVQDYIKDDFELNIVGLSTDHGNNVIIPGGIKKLRKDLVRMGEFMELNDLNKYEGLDIDSIKRFVKNLGYEGIFSIEFLCKGSTYYFLEINLRNDGLGYILTAAGANFPYMWHQYVNRLPINDGKPIHIKSPFYVMHENDLYNIIEKKISFIQWFKDFQRTDAFLIMNIKDPLPFIVSTLIHIRQATKKVLRKIFKINI